MNTILFLSLVSIISSIAIAYISLIFARSEEAKIVNEIQKKYPNNTLFYGQIVRIKKIVKILEN